MPPMEIMIEDSAIPTPLELLEEAAVGKSDFENKPAGRGIKFEATATRS
jgi:hypothetical protein